MTDIIPPWLVTWKEDETVFSLVSRLHQLWGHPLASTTARILFGTARGGYQHDLPTHLDVFGLSTGNILGTSEIIAKERTLYKYYRTFLPEAERQYLVDAMCGTSIAHLKLRLGILTSRFRANHPLKACPICMREDVARHGMAYWHLQHQYPGVWMCRAHGTPLFESTYKSTGVERFQWRLPRETEFTRRSGTAKWERSDHAAAINRLARTICMVVDACEAQALSHDALLKCYLSAVAERGWLTSAGNLRLREMAPAFLDYVQPFLAVPELSRLPASSAEAQQILGRLLRPMRSGTHPIRHFVMMDWLFGGAEAFLQRYAQIEAGLLPASALSDGSARRAKTDELPLAQVRHLLQDQKLSMRAAARELGVDVATVMVWAARCGISAARQPKKIKEDVREILIGDLRGGIDKADAAKAYGLSVQSITTTLRTEPGLHQAWQDARHQRAQQQARETWEGLIAQYGTQGIKYLRGLAPGAYMWLYRHDRTWLQAHLVPQVTNQQPRQSPVRWDARDEMLSRQVQEVALQIARERPGKAIHLWQLFQRLPELKTRLPSLARLPLTQRAIDAATKPPARYRDLFKPD